MKMKIPDKLSLQERLAIAALRNHWMAKRADGHEGARLVRIGRAQGYEEALVEMVGKAGKDRLFRELVERVREDRELADYIDAEPYPTPEMTARRIEKELEVWEKDRRYSPLKVLLKGRNGLARWVLDRAGEVKGGIRW